ncbi:MAG: PAS domain-containing protein [Spirochaetales bacterium]|jgi:PAS domain S-box-containing protein|nr:PAS domain-containing protein [Spirochaetales bacterium]
MRSFIRRALTKLDKLDKRQIRNIVYDLARENERFEGVMEAASDSIILTDMEYRVVSYNSAVEKFLLTSLFHGLYGRKIWSILTDRELAAFVQKTLEAGEIAMNRDFTLEMNGEKRMMNATLTPLAVKEKTIGYVFYMTDITVVRSQEARLRRAESLASFTTITAGVAHEIKNPLGAIGIHIQLIKKALQGKTSVGTKLILKNLNVVSEEVERLNKIVVDFLFAVRPVNIKPERRELNSLVREILDFVKVELKEHGIALEEKLTRNLPKIFIDSKAIRQAILNIIKNAMTAMPGGGTLTVATGKKNDCVRLTLSDTGVGIAQENLDKIFEPYFTTQESGSGLGLTNVFKIIKEHRADISVDSEPGKGAAFIISFPVPENEQLLLEYSKSGGAGQ